MTDKHERYDEAASSDSGPTCRVVTRREFILNTLVSLSIIGPLVAVAVSIVRYLIPPVAGIAGAKERVAVAAADELRDGQSKDFVLGGTPYALIRMAGAYRAFSKVCTHLGCIVEWRSQNRTFWCPCHSGVFDANGAVISGPPPRPLSHLTVNVADGKVYVEG